MNIKTKTFKSICPFCLYGCELKVNETNRGDFILRKVDYNPQSTVNQGRLCARGNGAKQILDDRKRLSYPLFNDKRIIWTDALKQINIQLKQFPSKEIAITYDINNTIEELTSIFSFAQELKVDTIARSYLEPEIFFSYGFDNLKYAELQDIIESNVFLIIGDVFGKTPVISKPILDAKYANRNNRLYYIDSVKTKIAGFANKFLWVKPGTEPLILVALITAIGKPAKDVLGDKNYNKLKKLFPKILETCCISSKDIEDIAQSLVNLPKGVVLASLDFGKTDDPLLFSALTQLITMSLPGDKKFCAPALASVPIGKTGFSDIIEKVNQGKIKALINFGDIFPFYYHEIIPTLNNLNLLITTSTYIHNTKIPTWLLPVPSLLEKSGTISTLWGKKSVTPLADPVNGTKDSPEIIGHIVPNLGLKSKSRLNYKSNIDIDEIIERAIGLIEQFESNDELIILGEETAFGYRGVFEDISNILKINRITANKYNINNGNSVRLQIDNKEKDFITNITNSVPIGAATISVNTTENRDLFPMRIDNMTKDVIIGTAKGKLSQLT